MQREVILITDFFSEHLKKNIVHILPEFSACIFKKTVRNKYVLSLQKGSISCDCITGTGQKAVR